MFTARRQSFVPAMATVLCLSAGPALAQSDAARIKDLEAQSATMAKQIKELQNEVARNRQSSLEWNNSKSAAYIAGYGSVSYVGQENGNDSFNAVSFNPIFYFQYGDRVLWESEAEMSIDDDGETDVGLEYSDVNIFLNDYLTLVAGKFISPLGNFRPNLHPSWINKLPEAPPGYGEDGAAPLGDVGIQLRGAVPVGGQSKINFATYIGNGPKLEAEGGELSAIDSEGATGDQDNEKVVGGRIAVLPVAHLEIGVSGAVGKLAVVQSDGAELAGDPSRDYQVLGADIAYQWKALDLRGEYIQQDVGDETGSVAPQGEKWKTWYVQGAWKFLRDKWEAVARYTDYDSPHPEDAQKQSALGLNYLLAPNIMVKTALEFNDGLKGTATDGKRWLLQFAYGF